MTSIYTKIINKESPAYIIHESEKFIAILDIFPIAKGHTLIIPKIEIDYIFDLENNLLAEMHIFAKKIALAIEKTIECKRIGVAVVGLEVPHAHIHLVPINNIEDIHFTKPKLKFSHKEFSEICQNIQKYL